MSNILEILTLESEQVQTVFHTEDGCVVTEYHNENKNESDVLRKLRENEFYLDLPGEWILKFSTENKIFYAKRFPEVIMQGLVYIHARDIPGKTSLICY